MSGTSVDGVDAALVDVQTDSVQLIGTASCKYPASLRSRLLELNTHPTVTLAELSELDHLVAVSFIEATTSLLKNCHTDASKITAIGSHGQTIFHSPDTQPATTMQIGDNSLIATRLGIDTIGDFRRADIAAGGQGAPLMPAFHQAFFGGDKLRFVLNLGGIANITTLGAETVSGFDTGPANTLLDAWIFKTLAKPCDTNGQWARAGKVDSELLRGLLADEYFAQPAPKSTGTDYFNLQWLENHLALEVDANNIQTTLTELTARTVADAIIDCTIRHARHKTSNTEVLVCGGGAHNAYLIERLEHCLPDHVIHPTTHYGLDSDFAEAMGFAWLAYRYLQQLPGNLPTVTGASASVVLGGRYVGNMLQ